MFFHYSNEVKQHFLNKDVLYEYFIASKRRNNLGIIVKIFTTERFSFGWAIEMKITFFYIISNKHMKGVNASTTNIYNLS